MMKNILLTFLLSIPCILMGQTPIKLTWNDLKPEISFEDPFKALTEYQLTDLRKVANIRQQENNKELLPPKVIREKDSLENLLAQQGVNIDYLLSIRQKITELRKSEAEGLISTFNGKQVRIAGYLLPLNYTGEYSTEFLLVPWVGACIHTPPPPKNQIIFFEFEKGYKVSSRFEAVNIEGIVAIEDKVSDLFLVDGTDKISTGYTLKAVSLSAYK